MLKCKMYGNFEGFALQSALFGLTPDGTMETGFNHQQRLLDSVLQTSCAR